MCQQHVLKMAVASKKEFRSSALLGLGAIALAAILWAVGANVAQGLFQSGITPFELVEARATISAVGLGVLSGLQTRKLSIWKNFQINGWILMLGLALALVNFTYYFAIARLEVAVAIVIQYTAPALIVLWIALTTRRLPSFSVGAAATAAIVGVVLVAQVSGGDVSQLDTIGLGSAFLSAILFATYTLLAERVGMANDAVTVMLKGFIVASLFWIAVQLPQGFPTSLIQANNLLGVLFVGVGGTLLPFLFYCWGIQRVRADRAAIAATLEPAIAAVIAWFWFGQALTPLQILGSILVLGAVLILQLNQKADL
ncbi:DMT family transporter [Chlorogloeopsis fritschii PCC 9212]